MEEGGTGTDLVQVGEAVGVLAQALVLSPDPISCCYLPELLQVHHVQRTAGGDGDTPNIEGVGKEEVLKPPTATDRITVFVCVCVPDVVFAPGEMARPVARLPEAISVHLPAALAERSVAVRRPLQVEVTQLLQVCSHNLTEREAQTKHTHTITHTHKHTTAAARLISLLHGC